MSILENEIYTEKQGQYLAFIYYYTKINRIPPAHADFESWFQTSPSTVHQMILQLEKKNLIRRMPNTPRSITISISEENLPKLK
jgi:DNA-binding MarR family transcriptional regulator